MTNEQIERLAMDLACAQMNEDTEALFRAYLEGHPEQKRIANEFKDLCDCCQRGIGNEEVPIPPLKPEVKPKPFDRSLLLKNYGRAAILLVGVFLGFGVGQLSHRSAETHRVQTASNRSAAALIGRIEDREGGFWRGKINDLEKPKLWVVQKKSDENETFWDCFRKELSNVQLDKK